MTGPKGVILRLAGVPEPFNLPWLLALERRAFVRAGIELKWHTVPEGTGAMCELLRDDEVDLAVLVTEGAVNRIAQGDPLRIVGALVDTALTWGVHVGAHTALEHPADLVGLPYAISRFNSGSHLMAMMHAKRHGWMPGEKDFIVVNDLKGAIERLRHPDPAVFLWEKSMTARSVHDGLLRRVEELKTDWPAFVVVAREAFLEENGDAVMRLMRVFRDQAKGFMGKKSGAEMIAQRYGMEQGDAAEWFNTVRWSMDGAIPPYAFSALSGALHQIGLMEAPAPAEDMTARVLWSQNRG